MKHIFIYLCLGLITFSCTNDIPPSIRISVLADKTSDDIPNPRIEDIHAVVGERKDIEHAISFSYQIIDNTDVGKRQQLTLDAPSAFENTLKRSMDVNTFFQTIDTLFQQEQAKDYHYQRSHIFNKLIEELRSVQSTTANKKIILLYSDLVEFSSLYNGYSSTHRSKMKKDFNIIVDTFASHLNTGDLNNVSLYIIYYPETAEQNQRFADFCKIYQEIFEGTGLTIHIGIERKIPSIHEN